MMLLPLLAQTMMVMPAAADEVAVPATAWSCNLTDAGGSVLQVSGRIPELPKGRDPNEGVRMELRVAGADEVGFVTGELGSEWTRDFQVTRRQGDATYVFNLRLRRDSEGVAWLTRYDRSLGALRQPYRYVSAGLCTADFDAKIASPK
jgi:hypothetical protein